MMRKTFAILMGIALAAFGSTSDARPPAAAGGEFVLTVLYDNTVAAQGATADWGFACLLESGDRTLLFDCGTQPDILQHNIGALGVHLDRVETIVLSHAHADHTGGLFSVLDRLRGRKVKVFMPFSFPAEFSQKVEQSGAVVERVSDFVEVVPGVFLTAETGDRIKEIGLILETAEGPALITGCAHPGIADMILESGRRLGRKVTLAMGGFHLLEYTAEQLSRLIGRFRELGVVRCGATHCTGDQAIADFREAYGSGFIPMGVGRMIRLAGKPGA